MDYQDCLRKSKTPDKYSDWDLLIAGKQIDNLDNLCRTQLLDVSLCTIVSMILTSMTGKLWTVWRPMDMV